LTAFYSAAPVCTPARAALLTGRYAIRSGVTGVLFPEDTTGLPASEYTLAEALRDTGYHTTLVGKWHLGSAPGYRPTDQGFDTFYGLLYSNDMMRPWVDTDVPLRLWQDGAPVAEYPLDQSTLTRRLTDEAVAFIRGSAEPFFLYFAHPMPHVPVARSEAFAGTSAAGRYGDTVEEIDGSVGELLRALDDTGRHSRTIVVFTSDNGANVASARFFTDDRIVPTDVGSNGPFRGHKRTTLEGGMRVPGIIAWPNRLPPGAVRTGLATAMDLYPTLLAYAGVDAADIPAGLDGRDIRDLLERDTASPHPYFFYFREDRLQGVRDATWKYRHCRDADSCTGEPELYHLARDPYERFSVALDHPEIGTRMRERLIAFARETGARIEGSE
jgi:arylsulfatase A-like enzyme